LVASRLVSITVVGVFVLVTFDRVSTSSRRANIETLTRPRLWRLPALAGALDMTANVLYLLAVRRGLLSIVVVVAALYPVSTVCLAFGLDGERVSKSQALGMALTIAALVLVSLGSSG
jgi:uncharacterized membrane protein